MDDIARCARLIGPQANVAVLTGAGVSKESGIPTFRDALTGLWADYDPEKLATAQGFLSDPPLVWQWYDWRRRLLADVEPNAGHYAIAEMESLAKRVVVITQNVDGLHARAGSTAVLELHGSITSFYCFDGHHRVDDVPLGLPSPPLCRCGSLVRPAVVWFGEMLPDGLIEAAIHEVTTAADVVFVVGTSGIVQPAASLPLLARRSGKKVVEINPEPTPVTPVCDIYISGKSGEILPQIVAAVRQWRQQAGTEA